MPVLRFFLTFLILALLGGGSQNLGSAPQLSEGILTSIESIPDLTYARYGNREIKLDLYRPKDREGALPAILCIHGGAWWKGDRKNIAAIAKGLAARGYITAAISYRLSGEEKFPAQIFDCKAAVRWLRENADRYGIDSTKIGATGSSAGGHLAALLATSAGVSELENSDSSISSAIQAAAPMGAQSDLETERIARRSKDPKAAFYPQFLGGTQEEVPEVYRLASPLHHLDESDPPVYFLTGELDDPSTRADAFRDKMAKLGIETGLSVLPDAPHPFPGQPRFFSTTIDLLDRFFSLRLKDIEIEEPDRPNFLFVVADDLRPELRCYGSPIAVTPHLDALAKRGMRFDRAYCQKAVCWPSRNSFFSGLMPGDLGKADATATFRESHPDIYSLPQWFKEHGWQTRGFGKILHNGQDDSVSWSEPLYEPPPKHYALPENAGKHPVINRSDPSNRVNPLFEAAEVADEAYEDGLTTEAAIRAIKDASASEPFFFMVGFHKPHTPFNAPQKYWNLYSRDKIALSPVPHPPAKAPLDYAVHRWEYVRSFAGMPLEGPMPEDLAREVRHAYYACVSYVDSLFGKLVTALDDNGMLDNTIIIFTSDHGYHLGDHSLWSKHTNFEIATRVPLLVSGPLVSKNAETSSFVELVDLYPTLCDLAGIYEPNHLQGKSFAEVLGDPDAKSRMSAYSEFNRKKAKGRSIRTDRFRYTEWRELDSGRLVARELYDHQQDPLESSNVVENERFKAVVSRLEKALTERK